MQALQIMGIIIIIMGMAGNIYYILNLKSQSMVCGIIFLQTKKKKHISHIHINSNAFVIMQESMERSHYPTLVTQATCGSRIGIEGGIVIMFSLLHFYVSVIATSIYCY